MCGLCGLFGVASANWAEVSIRDSGGAESRVEAAGARERWLRSAELRRILRAYRIDVDDFVSSGWVVRGPTGATEIVTSLDALWPAAERVARRRIDPLDPLLLTRIAARRRL